MGPSPQEQLEIACDQAKVPFGSAIIHSCLGNVRRKTWVHKGT